MSLRATFEIVAIAIVVALPLGIMAGFLRGWFDTVTMRVMDALFSFPPLVLALTVAALLGASINNAAVAIAIVMIPSFVRLIRGEVIAVREEAYVESAQSLGARPGRIMRTHVLPNVASPIIIQVALALGFALLAEAGLSFLGIGSQPPTPSWGDMLNEAYQFIFTAPLALVFPGLAIMLSVLSFNVVADGLRDAIGVGSTVARRRGIGERLRRRRAARAAAQEADGGPRPGPDPVRRALPPVAAVPATSDDHRAGSAGPTPLLDVDRLRVEFAINGGSWPVVEDLSFRIEPGRTLGLVGESGSGKTVSALAIMGLLPTVARVTDGSVRFEGRNLLELTPKELRSVRGDQIAMIFQDPMTCLNPAFTVGNQIAEQVRAHRDVTRKEANRIAVEMLDRVEIPGAASRVGNYPHQFSGGMRQRVMIAMALSCSPAAAHRRRAHHRTGRDHRGPDPRPPPHPVRRGVHGHDLRDPRSRRHRRDRRRGGGALRRPEGRAGRRLPAVRPAPAPLHRGAALLHAPVDAHRLAPARSSPAWSPGPRTFRPPAASATGAGTPSRPAAPPWSSSVPPASRGRPGRDRGRVGPVPSPGRAPPGRGRGRRCRAAPTAPSRRRGPPRTGRWPCRCRAWPSGSPPAPGSSSG